MPKDPICGMDVDKTTAIKSVKDGKEYFSRLGTKSWICSLLCRDKFLGKEESKKYENKKSILKKEDEAVIGITDMHCASCVLKIEKSLKDVEGVSDANVNLEA